MKWLLLALLVSAPVVAAEVQEGKASYYGGKTFQGKKTANGERFDQNKDTAASRTLPLGSEATVTNKENGKSVDVEINDRGPYVKPHERIIDLSKGAAKKLDMTRDGTAPVIVEPKGGSPEK